MITKDISYIKVTLPIISPKRVIEWTILRYLFILVLQKMWNNHSCSTPTDFFSTNDVRIYEPLIIGILQPGDITEPDRQAELYVKSLALFLRPFVILHITWLNLNPFSVTPELIAPPMYRYICGVHWLYPTIQNISFSHWLSYDTKKIYCFMELDIGPTCTFWSSFTGEWVTNLTSASSFVFVGEFLVYLIT